VRDVPVPHHEDFLSRGGSPLTQLAQIRQERRHETFLLLLPLGSDLTARPVQTGHYQPGELRFEITTAVVELVVAETDRGRGGFVPAVDGNAVPSLDLGSSRRVCDEPSVRIADVVGELFRLRTYLLAGNDIRGGVGQPFDKALPGRCTQAIDVDSGYPQHAAQTTGCRETTIARTNSSDRTGSALGVVEWFQELLGGPFIGIEFAVAVTHL